MSDVSLFDPNQQQIEPLTLTPAAIAHIKSFGKKGIRLVIKKTGCSGYAYHVEIFEEQQTEDHIFPLEDGLSIAVPKTFLDLVKGTRIDYVHEGLNSGFRFYNPNQKGACGCGESFTV
jgi:iron-sulfur cluster assembly accessory protein